MDLKVDMKVDNCLYCGSAELRKVTRRSDGVDILECQNCALMMVAELNEDTASLYGTHYFEKDNDSKSGYINYLSSPAANLVGKYSFARLFRDDPGTHIDLGSANGSLLEIFTSEGFNSIGLEISKEAVEIARSKGMDSRVSDLKEFSKDVPKASLITAFDLIEHVDAPKQVLQQVYSSLEEDGVFVFSTLSVKQQKPEDYWFNHSLEHYVYYNKKNLDYVLKDIFGEGSYHFEEASINGIYEFWGIAKKGKLTQEASLMESIFAGKPQLKDERTALLACIFYNQLSRFVDSKKLISEYSGRWHEKEKFIAEFLNYFYEGKFEVAAEYAAKHNQLVSLKDTIYWQALSYILSELKRINEDVIIKEYTQELIALREDNFKLKDELHSLKNARLLGKIIKIRAAIGSSRHRLRMLPGKVLHRVRVIVAPSIPGPVRKFIKRTAKQVLFRDGPRNIKIEHVRNDKWQAGQPLVSVVIPYYNRSDTIDETLDSLANQTFIDFDITLVDDGSTDPGSIVKLNEISKIHPTIKIINQKNQGVAATRNNGIKQAKGKYIICLDSDDCLEPTFIEKCTTFLEANPDYALATTYMNTFGVVNGTYKHVPYNPAEIVRNNMVITAAEFKKHAWRQAGGYKSKIGYEDWEFWVSLSERGFWGKLIPEPLFRYRTAMESRYIGDKDVHWSNLKSIRKLHPNFKNNIKNIQRKRQGKQHVVESETAFVNLNSAKQYRQIANGKPNVMIAIPWMTFGGAETLILNSCNEVKNDVNLSFVTGLESEHEWEHKFKDITPRVYHLANLFQHPALYLEFFSNYILTREIDVLHIIHTAYVFDFLPELKRRYPKLKVVVTMFNDRAAHFDDSLKVSQYIDAFVSDNQAVYDHYRKELGESANLRVIPNGIDSTKIYNPILYDRHQERKALGLNENDLAVFFIGRLSEEKNPDVFIKIAEAIVKKRNDIKFFIIGDGVMRHAVEKAVAKVHSKNIKFLGYQAEIARYLSCADIFLLPSSIEGFPLSVLEAMAMRVAVVASDVGAVSDVINSGTDGLVVRAVDTSEFIESVNKLSNDADLLSNMKNNARKKVEKLYSDKILGKNYRRLYKDMT